MGIQILHCETENLPCCLKKHAKGYKSMCKQKYWYVCLQYINDIKIPFSIGNSSFFCNFVLFPYAFLLACSRNAGNDIIKRRLLGRLVFWHNWNFATFKSQSKNKATVDVCVVCSYPFRVFFGRCRRLPYISARASALLVQLTGQCEGLNVWDEWRVQIPAFF